MLPTRLLSKNSKCLSNYSSSRFFISSKAVDLSYSTIGDPNLSRNTPIIILHGLLGNKRNYRGIGKVLRKLLKCSVIPVDLRNHGNSPHVSPHNYEALAADVIKLFEKLSINRARLIGHSMGGRTAMAVSLLEPSIIAKMVVIDISPVSSPKQLSEYFKTVLLAMQGIDFSPMNTVREAKREVRKQLRTLISDDKILNAVAMNIVMKRQKIGWKVNLDVLIKDFEHILSLPNSLKGLTYPGPTLFIGGQLSEFLPPDDLNPIRAMFPSAVVKYIPKVGHNLHVEDTATFLEMTINFLK